MSQWLGGHDGEREGAPLREGDIEPGRFDARLAFKKMRNPPWKQVVIEQLGADYAEAVRASTQAVTRCELVIIEHAIPPLWRKPIDESSERHR